MKGYKKIAALLLSLTVLAGSAVACGNKTEKGEIDKIKENGKIRIGVFSDKPPFGYVDKDGKKQGFDVEIAKAITKDLLGSEDKVEFVLVEAQNRVEYLESNKVDIILANFTVTPERKEKVDFVKPYMNVALGVVSKDGKVKSVDDLKGKTLIVNKGTTAESYFTKNHPDIKLSKFDQNTEAFQALKDVRGDALAHDNTLVLAWAKENKGFEVGVPSLGDQDKIAAAVKKGNKELYDWLNLEFEKLGKDGVIRKAYEKTLLPVYGDGVKPEDLIIEK
ncbi:MAG: cysteine ABC transporter substrate-binding protein [Clostridium sp.]